MKRILEQTLVVTVYGADPVPRLNVEIAGLALPPIKFGLFYSSPNTMVMPKKYHVDVDTFYIMNGPLTENSVVRFMTWSGLISNTFTGRIKQICYLLRALEDPKFALQLAGGHLGVDHVLMFKPETFIKGLQNLPDRSP